MAAKRVALGAFRTEFERGLIKYAQANPEWDLGEAAMILIRKAYDRGDDRTFFGGIAQLAKIMGDHREDGGQADMVLIVDRRAGQPAIEQQQAVG